MVEEQIVRIVAWPKENISVCLRVCEPICVQSDYTIAITVFDRPVASITLQGLSRIFNCGDREIP